LINYVYSTYSEHPELIRAMFSVRISELCCALWRLFLLWDSLAVEEPIHWSSVDSKIVFLLQELRSNTVPGMSYSHCGRPCLAHWNNMSRR